MLIYLTIISFCLCFVVHSKLEWNVVDLLEFPWNVEHSFLSDQHVAWLSISMSQLSGFQELHLSQPSYEEKMFFELNFAQRLDCPPEYLSTTDTSRPTETKMTVLLDGNAFIEEDVSSQNFENAPAFTLLLDGNIRLNRQYTLAFATSQHSCAVRLDNITLTYLSQPAKIDLSTTSDAFHFEERQSLEYTQQPGGYRIPEHRDSFLSSKTGLQTAIPRACDLLGSSDAVLLNKVVFDEEYSTVFLTQSQKHKQEQEQDVTLTGATSPLGAPQIRLFCGVYTTADRHESHVRVIRHTWGRKCTGFVALSTATDLSLPAVKIPHLGVEKYQNIWQKVRSIWKYVHLHYAQDYDYFLLGGDDMYHIIENLYLMLASPEVEIARAAGQGVYLGRLFRAAGTHGNIQFHSGGPGYLLDHVALRILAENLDRPHCQPYHVSLPYEDVNVARCLAGAYSEREDQDQHAKGEVEAKENMHTNNQDDGIDVDSSARESQESSNSTSTISSSTRTSVGGTRRVVTPVLPLATKDAEGLQRFHPLPPGAHWRYQPASPDSTVQDDWLFHYDPTIQGGFNCCSAHSVAFHYIDPPFMRAIDDYLYRCPAEFKKDYFETHGAVYCETSSTVQLSHG